MTERIDITPTTNKTHVYKMLNTVDISRIIDPGVELSQYLIPQDSILFVHGLINPNTRIDLGLIKTTQPISVNLVAVGRVRKLVGYFEGLFEYDLKSIVEDAENLINFPTKPTDESWIRKRTPLEMFYARQDMVDDFSDLKIDPSEIIKLQLVAKLMRHPDADIRPSPRVK